MTQRSVPFFADHRNDVENAPKDGQLFKWSHVEEGKGFSGSMMSGVCYWRGDHFFDPFRGLRIGMEPGYQFKLLSAEEQEELRPDAEASEKRVRRIYREMYDSIPPLPPGMTIVKRKTAL